MSRDTQLPTPLSISPLSEGSTEQRESLYNQIPSKVNSAMSHGPGTEVCHMGLGSAGNLPNSPQPRGKATRAAARWAFPSTGDEGHQLPALRHTATTSTVLGDPSLTPDSGGRGYPPLQDSCGEVNSSILCHQGERGLRP